ncbi:YdcF family protein [Fructobacillus ficulneus]|uniref:DUF218 domain-containing protein n=1 Tax=Fructobacillus ficulneus TaxID=157463 RepID=A0A0K8MGJ5_9LACO|nr:YdcF family protein [Fructobacillus ficulneus]GAO99323.1 hypothetical protein FFIC_091510 [Fructobacillus ficulneus]
MYNQVRHQIEKVGYSMLTTFIYLFLAIFIIAGLAIFLDKQNFIFASLLMFSLIIILLALYLRLAGWIIDRQIPVLNILIILLPPVLLVTVVVWLGRNTSIISHKEGKSFTAKLSLFLALSILFDFYLIFFVGNIHGKFLIFSYALAVMVYNTFFLLFISYLLYSFLYQILPTPKGANYLIVLGSYVHDGKVTPLLQSRVDRALSYYHQAGEIKPKFVVSGGQGSDESISEVGAMRNYLLSVGVPDSDILVEDQSRNTFENFMFSKEKILEDWQSSKKPIILFSTSNYHVTRATLFAKKIDLDARGGMGAPTSFYFLPTALIREYIGILSYYRLLTFLLFLIEAFLAYLLAY